MLQRTAFALCFFLLFAVSVEAQEQSLWLAGIDMRLGASQEIITKRILESYNMTPLGESKDNYMIVERPRGNERPNIIGSVGFKQSRLVLASKEWYENDEGSDYKLGDAIYSVLAEMEKRGEVLIEVRTGNRRAPGFTEESVELNYGKRSVKILMFEYKGSKTVQVKETLASSQ